MLPKLLLSKYSDTAATMSCASVEQKREEKKPNMRERERELRQKIIWPHTRPSQASQAQNLVGPSLLDLKWPKFHCLGPKICNLTIHG